jgi:hypothetical protein
MSPLKEGALAGTNLIVRAEVTEDQSMESGGGPVFAFA